jgi:hypothetical protein
VTERIQLRPEPSPAEVLVRLQPLRRLRRQYLLVNIGFLPAIIGFGIAALLLFPHWRPLQTIFTIGGGFGYMWWSNRIERRVIDARCPRCAAFFHGPSPFGLGSGLPRHWYRKRCQTCGLRLDGSNAFESET